MVSGIFVADREFRDRDLQQTMETLLADGLREAGVDVTTGGHSVLEKWDADVVHLHHLANACSRMFLPQRIPVVFTRHATKPLPQHHQAVLKATYRRASAVVALSKTEARGLNRSVAPEKLRTIYNGTDDRHFPLTMRARPRSRWRFVYVGQLIELKRVHLAVELIADLVADGFDVELDVISHRPTLLPEILRLALDLGVAHRVNFHGPHTRSELGVALGNAHVLLQPSRTEALPTVVTEAIFSGLPVASFDVGGVSEQLPPGMALPAPSDIAGWRRMVREILSGYEAKLLDYAAHSTVARQRFSIDEMVREHIAMYRDVTDES
ncbi:glycosyltransferase family 4 protein [Microbacterium esteraromaticum]|uniref:glycosyltransferase family 4 protein n=1 Tax=Microbacterium esteraromaticum TaxID=57043 RepID=UPI0019D368F6|nr:glycosyltransferase family 4 protein [Microbacterium esteraromaticum]MBN7793382.1 glycosyltransferase family 4 protein [Microbacterium esteraromaticum]